MLQGTPGGRMAVRRSSDVNLQAQQDARQAAFDQQRMEALAQSAASLPLDKKAALMAKFVEASEGEACALLLGETVGAAAHADRLDLLTSQLDQLEVTDLMSVLTQVLQALSADNRQVRFTLARRHRHRTHPPSPTR